MCFVIFLTFHSRCTMSATLPSPTPCILPYTMRSSLHSPHPAPHDLPCYPPLHRTVSPTSLPTSHHLVSSCFPPWQHTIFPMLVPLLHCAISLGQSQNHSSPLAQAILKMKMRFLFPPCWIRREQKSSGIQVHKYSIKIILSNADVKISLTI